MYPQKYGSAATGSRPRSRSVFFQLQAILVILAVFGLGVYPGLPRLVIEETAPADGCAHGPLQVCARHLEALVYAPDQAYIDFHLTLYSDWSLSTLNDAYCCAYWVDFEE